MTLLRVVFLGKLASFVAGNSISDAADFFLYGSIMKHGCHCSRIFSDADSSSKSEAIDAVDSLCLRWQAARRCAANSDRCANSAFTYDFYNECMSQEVDWCSYDLCNLDSHFAKLINEEIEQGWTPEVAEHCEHNSGPHKDRSGLSCCLNTESWQPHYYEHAWESCNSDGSVTDEPEPCSVDDVADIAAKLDTIPNLSFGTSGEWGGPVPASGNLCHLNGLLKQKNPEKTTPSDVPARKRRAVLPATYDARNDADCGGLVGITRNQGGCGSCYAFSIANSLTHALCKASGGASQKMLSTMDLLNCCTSIQGNPHDSCAGGWMNPGMTYFAQTGVCTGTNVNNQYGKGLGCYPYGMGGDSLAHFDFSQPMVPTCPVNCHNSYPISTVNADKSGADATIQPVFLNGHDEESVKQHIYEHGGVTAGFTVYKDFFCYSHGVYTVNSNERAGAHAIVIIGWGVENGMKYWLCQNSWSANWGMGGLFKIRRGTNEANIEGMVQLGGVKWNCPADKTVNAEGKCVNPPSCSATHYLEGSSCVPCPFGGKSNAQRTGCLIRSINGDTPVTVNMINRSGHTAVFRWINHQGKNNLSGPTVANGQSIAAGTYMTHPWLIIVNGQEIFLAAPPAGSAPWVDLVVNSNLQAMYVNNQVGFPVSIGGGATSDLSFKNLCNANLDVYWIQGDGTLKHYGTVKINATILLSTYANHMWAVKHANGAFIWGGHVTNQDVQQYGGKVLVEIYDHIAVKRHG